MSHHAKDRLWSLLGQVEGLSDDQISAELAAYDRELLKRFTHEVSERFTRLGLAFCDEDGKMYERVAPLYHLLLGAMLDTEEDFTRSV